MRLCVDLLRHVYQGEIVIASLMTGDADFVPLIEEVVGRGTQVWLGAFWDGLSDKLTPLADSVTILDDHFSRPLSVRDGRLS